MMETPKIATMLMFGGQAEEAIGFYASTFAGSSIEFLQHYGPDFPGPEGQVVHARFILGGQLFLAMDSAVAQPFSFTPAISFFVTCDDEAEANHLYSALSKDGEVLMPLDTYPFARKYAWVQDRFGVSWQLTLP